MREFFVRPFCLPVPQAWRRLGAMGLRFLRWRLRPFPGWAAGGAFVLAVAVLAGCGEEGGGSNASRPKPSAFIFARGSDAQKLDPADVDDGESVNALAQICQGLVRFKPGSLEIEPCLAVEREVSEDGLTYRFRLREGVSFHDGTPLDAESAAFSFRRQLDPDHPGHFAEAAFSYWNYLYQDVEAVEVAGPMELVFRLKRPNAAFLRSLAIFPAWLVSPGALERHGAGMQRRPVGTGPYRFVEWRPNEAIVLERNEDYWEGPPAFERLVLRVTPDNTVRLMQLQAGSIHGMDGLEPSQIEAAESSEQARVHRTPGLNLAYLVFNTKDPRLSDASTRRALAMAIDRERLAEVAVGQAGRPAVYPLPPGMLGYPEEEASPVPYDPEAARRRLADAEADWSEPLVLKTLHAPRPYLPDPTLAASFIKGQLESAGVPVRVVASDFKAHLNDLRNGRFEAALIGWVGDNGDPDNFLGVFFGSWAAVKGSATNFSFYESEEMDAFLRAGRRETDPLRRRGIYEKALALWGRDLPLLPLVHADHVVAMAPEIVGFKVSKIGDLHLGALRWEPRSSRR